MPRAGLLATGADTARPVDGLPTTRASAYSTPGSSGGAAWAPRGGRRGRGNSPAKPRSGSRAVAPRHADAPPRRSARDDATTGAGSRAYASRCAIARDRALHGSDGHLERSVRRRARAVLFLFLFLCARAVPEWLGDAVRRDENGSSDRRRRGCDTCSRRRHGISRRDVRSGSTSAERPR